MLFQIALARNVIEIVSRNKHFADTLSSFICKEQPAVLSFSATDTEMDEVWQRTAVTSFQRNRSYRIGLEPIFERQVIYTKICDHLPQLSAILMHGVVVSDSRSAYMYTAPSGTGKSTRGQLFIGAHPDFFILNGDKPLIRVEENQVIACGSPWKGKEGYGVNTEAPLKAIFLLERADETELTELTIGEAFDFLVKQTYIPSDPVNAVKALQLLKSFEGKVRLFRFRSTPTIESVEAAWRAANS